MEMIQGLLGGVLEHDRKLAAISAAGLLVHESYSPTTHSSSSIPSVSPLTSPMPASPSPLSSAAASPEMMQQQQRGENLRCPRCDSSNTKFCYYNNYNLTQPRHFCKTCRRYWTKGGALRNVPIGGGCRKAKPPSIIPSSVAAAKPKVPSTSDFLMINSSSTKSLLPCDHQMGSNPVPCWANSAHLLALLNGGAAGIHNPNPSAFPFLGSGRVVKEEAGGGGIFGSQNFMGLDSSGQCGPFWRNPNQQFPYQQQQQQLFSIGAEAPAAARSGASEIQDLYQKIRASVGYGGSDDQQLPLLGIASGGASGGSAASTMFAAAAAGSSGDGVAEASPVLQPGQHSASEFRYWNVPPPAAAHSSWSDMTAVNGGAFP